MAGEASRYQTALDAAVDAAREAGKLIRDDFHRPGGPRGSGSHAEVDEEAERVWPNNSETYSSGYYRTMTNPG